MSSDTPRVTRTYRNHHLDSTRWDVFEPRDDDIVITTSYKCGTTWAQQIVQGLLRGVDDPKSLQEDSAWVDADFMGESREDMSAKLEAFEERRFLKSHLPLDGLPWYPQVRYIVVGRDPRDVFMSLFNHYDSYTEMAFAMLNRAAKEGEDLPPCPEDPRTLWQDWITRGWFPWESEGWPMWSNLHHTQTYWEYRQLPNIFFLHYADMLADLDAAVRRVATFIGVTKSDDEIARIVRATTFATVKEKAEQETKAAAGQPEFFRGGASAFIFKGTNGRWRDVLTAEDLKLYEQACERVLSPDCAAWLERGDAALDQS